MQFLLFISIQQVHNNNNNNMQKKQPRSYERGFCYLLWKSYTCGGKGPMSLFSGS